MGLVSAVIPEEIRKNLQETTQTLNDIKALLEELVEIERRRDAKLLRVARNDVN